LIEESELGVGIEDKVVEGFTVVTWLQFPLEGLSCLGVEREVIVADADTVTSADAFVDELSVQRERACLIIVVARSKREGGYRRYLATDVPELGNS